MSDIPYGQDYSDAPWPDGTPADDAEHQDADSGSEPSDDPNEYEIQERLHRLRIQHEARRRLDEELRPQIVLPAVTPLDELLAEPDTPTRYRIDRLALDGARIMLSAQYKAGKTTIVANLLRALADGEKFLGRFDVKIPATRIVLIDDELDRDTMKRWLRDQQIVNSAAIVDTVSLRGRLGSFNLLDDRCRDQWSQRLSDLGCDYLILDCLRPVLDALGLDENRDAGQFLVPFDTMLYGAGVSNSLMVQHMGHHGERSRGDSRLQDWPDAIWRLVRESEEPDSARFFSAFGRDVNVPEGRLSYNDRRLSYSDGNRADARTRAALLAIVECLVRSKEPLSGSAIEDSLGGNHTRAAIRNGCHSLIARGVIVAERGKRNATLHRIANPCQKCHKPVMGGGSVHVLSCPKLDDNGLFDE
jgi:hypothetical protein